MQLYKIICAEIHTISYFFAGNVLTAFTLLPNSGNSLSLIRNGQVKLSLKFRQALDEPVNAVVYCMYQQVLELGRNKLTVLS